VRNAEGQIIKEGRVRTSELRSFLEKRPQSRVIVETCSEAFSVADDALACGHEVRVVPATLARALGIGSRRIKNDLKDGRVLSEVSSRIDLPSVHIPSSESRRNKAQCGSRDALVHSRTALVNNVRGWMRTQRVTLKCTPKCLPERVRQHFGEQLPAFIETQLQVLEVLNNQIKAVSNAQEKSAKEDRICRLLMTMPGIGPITAMRYRAAVDEVGRFKNAHDVESYFGLTPGEDSSSERKRILSITKAGSSEVRWTLVQAAWCYWRLHPNQPMGQWATAVAHRRGRQVAAVALARKMAGILWSMWRQETSFDHKRASIPRQETVYRLKS